MYVFYIQDEWYVTMPWTAKSDEYSGRMVCHGAMDSKEC
jgi:hypothetical protein